MRIQTLRMAVLTLFGLACGDPNSEGTPDGATCQLTEGDCGVSQHVMNPEAASCICMDDCFMRSEGCDGNGRSIQTLQAMEICVHLQEDSGHPVGQPGHEEEDEGHEESGEHHGDGEEAQVELHERYDVDLGNEGHNHVLFDADDLDRVLVGFDHEVDLAVESLEGGYLDVMGFSVVGACTELQSLYRANLTPGTYRLHIRSHVTRETAMVMASYNGVDDDHHEGDEDDHHDDGIEFGQ